MKRSRDDTLVPDYRLQLSGDTGLAQAALPEDFDLRKVAGLRVGMDSEQHDKGEPDITNRLESYPEDDIDRLAKEFWEWIKREKIPAHGWITALSSIALLAVTFGQLVISCQNFREASPLVEYARRSTEAAETQDGASLRNAKAAENFSATAGLINAGIGDAVKRLQGQVDAVERSRKASQDASSKALDSAIANFHEEQRAWVAPKSAHFSGETNPPTRVNVIIDYANPGKEPAFKVIGKANGGLLLPPMFPEEAEQRRKTGPIFPVQNYCDQAVPRDGMPTLYPATVQQESLVRDNGILLGQTPPPNTLYYVSGCFGCETMGEVHHSAFCYWLKVEGNGDREFVPCLVGNYAD